MAANQPKKAGEYERPATASSSTGLVIGIVVAVILVVLALLYFR